MAWYSLPDGRDAFVVWDVTMKYGLCKYLNEPTSLHLIALEDVSRWREIESEGFSLANRRNVGSGNFGGGDV